MGYVYLVTNKINGKQYVGQSLQKDINKRWYTHKIVKKAHLGQILYNAYKKYGVENFDYKIICICFDEDTNKYEEEYIKKYNTIYPIGYNLLGGGGNKHHNEYTKKMLSEKLSGANNPNYGVKYSPERCETMSKAILGIKNAQYGKKFTQQEKEKRLQMHRDRPEIGEKISNSLKEYYKNNITADGIIKNPNCVRINQYTLNGEFVKSYYSISEASREINISVTTISRACSTDPKYFKYKTAGGFIWKRE